LNSLLTTYNLSSKVDFPTETRNKSSTSIDNIFINVTSKGDYTTFSLINGLSDHDPQFMLIHIAEPHIQISNILMTKKINKYSINESKLHLSFETWEGIFEKNDINNMFNVLLNRFLNVILAFQRK
jgi:hypothetical protein